MARPTSAERGREVRRRLLDAAAELIPELGWGEVSTRVLAERAGVTPGLVHYHYGSLQKLLAEAALAVARRVLAEPLAVLSGAPDAPSGINRLLRALDAYTGTDPTSLLFIETYLAATRDDSLRHELAALLAGFRAELAGWLREDGQVPRAEATAAVLVAAIDGVLLHRALDPSLRSVAVLPVLRRLVSTAEARPDRGVPDEEGDVQ